MINAYSYSLILMTINRYHTTWAQLVQLKLIFFFKVYPDEISSVVRLKKIPKPLVSNWKLSAVSRLKTEIAWFNHLVL